MTTPLDGLRSAFITQSFGLLLIVPLAAAAQAAPHSPIVSKHFSIPCMELANKQTGQDRDRFFADRIPLQVLPPDDLDAYWPQSQNLAQATPDEITTLVILMAKAPHSKN